MKKFLLVAALAGLAANAPATLSLTNNWSVGTAIPDNNYSGWINSRTVAAPAGFTIVPGTLTVSLNLGGGWNGDLYAYLVHGAGFTELLNRVGTGPGGAGIYGYGDAGMNVTLGSSGTPIHLYGGTSTFSGVPTGTYQADGSGLSSFNGLDPAGTWTLFVADLNGGGVTTVTSWSLQMDIVAVPEVETWVAAVLAGAFGAFWSYRRLRGARST